MVMRFESIFVRALTVAAVVSLPAVGHAQIQAPAATPADVPRMEAKAPQPLPAVPIDQWRISTHDEPALVRSQTTYRAPQLGRRANVKTGVKRALMGAAFGFGGFMAGGLLGARIEGTGCNCDDPGLKGFVIGAPIGAVVGAVIGVAMIK